MWSLPLLWSWNISLINAPSGLTQTPQQRATMVADGESSSLLSANFYEYGFYLCFADWNKIFNLEHNYSHWFGSPIWRFLKTKAENQTKSPWFLLVLFNFRVELKIINFFIWFNLKCDLIDFFLIHLHF